jgi:serine/threonine protein kinase
MQPEQLGPYRITKQLGKGGMGTVYEGQSVDSGRCVAIKVLNPQLAAADGFRERFEAEIESLKKLRHPAIVRLYGYGEQDGCLYYSMELVEGPTLDRQLRQGRQFDWHEVTRIGVQIAKALKHAHDHGVIHRDIKPANLLVDPQGQVKLSDFGIARVFGGTQLTAAGGILGTAEYMSPEQASGTPLDPRCDQYSLGCVLYALLTGRPPFRATGLPELLQLQRFASPEPVRSFAPSVPEELERIISQLLSKDPTQRFRTALVLARRLEAMEKALMRQTPRAPEDAATGDREPRRPDWNGLAETRQTDTSQDEGQGEVEVEEAENGLSDDAETALSVGPTHPATPAAPTEAENRFTTIEEAERRERLHQREPTLQTLVQGLVLLISLLLLAYVAWYVTRPRSSSDLADEITAAVADDQADSLLRVRSAIDQFMRRFPDDPRVEEIAGYQRQVRLLQLERRLQGRARRGDQLGGLPPGEQLYVAAVRLAKTDPEAALAQLEALADLHEVVGSDAQAQDEEPAGRLGESTDTGRIATLATREVERLRRQIDAAARAHREVLETRLRAAERLRDSDLAQARRIWHSLVHLYGDKPWARDLVTRARSELTATGQTPSAPRTGPATAAPGDTAAAPRSPATDADQTRE